MNFQDYDYLKGIRDEIKKLEVELDTPEEVKSWLVESKNDHLEYLRQLLIIETGIGTPKLYTLTKVVEDSGYEYVVGEHLNVLEIKNWMYNLGGSFYQTEEK